jgi:putative heme-binding domain-containing protein
VIDPATETVLMKWSSTDHNGGNLRFGTDGYLYFSIGDGQPPSPPDPQGTGQDISDVQASILRIDVNNPSEKLPYGIPPDNPFVKVPNARHEIWAFGVRNPWKMAFHPTTNELWVGDVGWEMREMIYRIDRGANYGWSVMEGSQVVKPLAPRHSIPISKPLFEHDHVDARSITGGFFWQSDKYPELKDAYIYGDWMTGKIWGLKHDGLKVTWHKELADTPYRIISFALDDSGEVFIVAYNGTIHELIPNPDASDRKQSEKFPTRLSQTGLFSSTVDLVPAPGVIPYSINGYHFSDHTFSRQWIGIPGEAKLSVNQMSDWRTGQIAGDLSFPNNTVLAKTVFFRTNPAKANSVRRLETQLLHRHHDDWNAYNYVWNDDQTDATLQPDVATEKVLEIVDENQPDVTRKQIWLHASRGQCMLCHIWSAGTAHGFKLDQLNRRHGSESENQLEKFERYGLFQSPISLPKPAISPSDETASLELRARQYLHLNCAHCHRSGGGGTSAFVLNGKIELEKMELVDAPAVQGDFGIPAAKVIASGKPSHSVLVYRMLKSGRGHMPQFGPTLVDEEGVRLICQWIESLGDSAGSNRETEVAIDQLASAFNDGSPELASNVDVLLDSTPTAISLVLRFAEVEFPDPLKLLIADRVVEHSKMEIRSLFERFLPDDRRKKRMGNVIDAEAILGQNGDAERGRKLFFETDLTCKQCHQINGKGQMIGPDLSKIGSQRKRAEILESIINSSAQIDDKYRGHIVVTSSGDVITGLVVKEDAREMVLRDGQGKSHLILKDEIEESRAMKKSLMPDQLLSEMSMQEAADLLSFLTAQKSD